MRALVTFGSKRGGTEGIARVIAETLQRMGVVVELEPAAEVDDVRSYDGVVVGGALYLNRWHKDARRFVKRHADALRTRSVWFFSSGPLDSSASEREIAPIDQVYVLMRRVGARGHVTFGGRLTPDAKGFLARSMAKTRAGDWRDMDRVRTWARAIARSLRPVRVAASGPEHVSP